MLSPEAWTALAAWVTALATIVLVWFTLMAVRWQAKEQRALHAVDLALRLSDRFTSAEMRWHRQQLSTMLIQGPLPAGANESSRRILDFFDTIGVLVGNGMLSTESAWSDFWWDAGHYHEALAPRILWIRAQHGNDPTLHSDFDDLFRRLLEYESTMRKIPVAQAQPTPAAVTAFLQSETALAVAPPLGVSTTATSSGR